MSYNPPKKVWSDETPKREKSSKKSSSSVLETFEKERFIPASSPTDEPNIPELEDTQDLDIPEAPIQTQASTYKALNIEILKKSSINQSLDDIDLSPLMDCLIPESDLTELDEIWNWNTIFTSISASLSDEKS